MISALCFSKNRAMQLDILLKSIYINAPYITDIGVLYLPTDEKFNEAYEILKTEHPNVKFLKETNFPEQVIEFVKQSNKYYTGLVDEAYFYKKSDVTEDRLNWVFNEKKSLSFSLRIGKNTVWQNHWHSHHLPPINVLDQYKDVIVWDANEYDVCTDLGRNLHCDGTIIERDLYLKFLLEETGWRSPRGKVRTLDGIGNSGRNYNPSLMASFEESSFVNNAVTLVHLLEDGRLYADNWGKYIRYNINELNLGFLDGVRIDLEKLPKNNITCGRIETEYSFYKGKK